MFNALPALVKVTLPTLGSRTLHVQGVYPKLTQDLFKIYANHTNPRKLTKGQVTVYDGTTLETRFIIKAVKLDTEQN